MIDSRIHSSIHDLPHSRPSPSPLRAGISWLPGRRFPQVVHMVCKWNSGCGLWPAATVSVENCDRRQSVSRQPSFTLSEWTDAQEDLMDLDPEPQTPVFDLGAEPRGEGDAATLTVTSVGLQERWVHRPKSRRSGW